MFNSKKEIDKKIDELLLREPSSENLNIIGDLFLRKGDRKRAIDYFMRAAKNTTTPKKAIALYKKILRFSPLDTEVYEALVDVLERSYNIPEAIKYLKLLSRLYQNKGETIKFTEIQRRISSLRQDWEKIQSLRGLEKSGETEPQTFIEEKLPDQDLRHIEETTVTREVKKEGLRAWRFITGIAFLLTIIVLSIIFLLRKEMPGEYQIQKKIGSYDIMVSSVTEKSIKDLPPIPLTPEDLRSASFSLITIKTSAGCIPDNIIENTYDYISCLNKKGEAMRPLASPVTEKSRRIIYRYGICSKGNDPVFTEFCIACPRSHSSGIKINGLVTDPLVLSWEKR